MHKNPRIKANNDLISASLGVRVDGPRGPKFDRAAPDGLGLTAPEGPRVVVGGFAAGMNKTVQPGFARGKQANRPCGRWKSLPPLVAAPPPFPLFEGALWALSIVPYVSEGKSREAYSAP